MVLDSLSILQMTLDDPAELQTDWLSRFAVLQIHTLSGVFDVVSGTGVRRRTIVDQGLQVDNVVRRDCFALVHDSLQPRG